MCFLVVFITLFRLLSLSFQFVREISQKPRFMEQSNAVKRHDLCRSVWAKKWKFFFSHAITFTSRETSKDTCGCQGRPWLTEGCKSRRQHEALWLCLFGLTGSAVHWHLGGLHESEGLWRLGLTPQADHSSSRQRVPDVCTIHGWVCGVCQPGGGERCGSRIPLLMGKNTAREKLDRNGARRNSQLEG